MCKKRTERANEGLKKLACLLVRRLLLDSVHLLHFGGGDKENEDDEMKQKKEKKEKKKTEKGRMRGIINYYDWKK